MTPQQRSDRVAGPLSVCVSGLPHHSGMMARTVRLSASLAFVLAVACFSSGEGGPARQVAGEFRSSELAAVRSAETPQLHPTFPAPGRTGISEADARRLAEQLLRGGLFPLTEGGILAREIHFTTRDEMLVLSSERALGFSMSALPPASELFWIVNLLDFRGDNEFAGYSGAVLDAETGEALLTFLNRSVPVGGR